MQIYNVYQSGKRLYIDEKEIPDNKIVVNKYDNMQQTLRLVSDGTLPPRLYWALRNPKLSQKYFILKLVNNEDLIVGTDISATPGLWDMLLIGTDEDYIIEGADIDQSRLTYVSDHFGRLYVRDNFLEELDFEEQCSPTFKVFYDEIMFRLDNIPDLSDIPDKMSDLENDTNFISGVAFKDDGEGNVNIIGTTFSGGETEEGGGGNYNLPVANETTLGGVKPLNKTDDMTLEVGVAKDGRLFAKGKAITVDSELSTKSENPVQNKVVAKEVNSLKEKDKSLDKEVKALQERNAKLEETVEKLQIKTTTSPSPFHHITDSADFRVLDFGMSGNTTQDGTPTPENQVEIVNAGKYNEATGRYEIGCSVGNKNLFNCGNSIPSSLGIVDGNIFKTTAQVNGIFSNLTNAVFEENTQYVVAYSKSIVFKDTTITGIQVSIVYTDGTYEGFYMSERGTFGKISKANKTIKCIQSNNPFGTGVEYENMQIYKLTDGDEYIPPHSQQIILTSPVPLTKWDKLVKRDGVWGWSVPSRYKKFLLDNWKIANRDSNRGGVFFIYKNFVDDHINTSDEIQLCTHFIPKNPYSHIGDDFWLNNSELRVGLSDETITTVEAFVEKLESLGEIGLWYESTTEEFHPLPEEEQTLLNNLETYYGVTNLYNEQGCPMWLRYCADNKLYVDQKLEQINNALLSLGANV